ncbi:MAG: helix-turn-helix domain-containing protein [Elusimicrobiales bacterium]
MAREFYSLPEVAALLGISRIAVFKRVKKGQLEALRIGRNWAVPAAALPAAAPAVPSAPPLVPPAPVVKPRASGPAAAADTEMDSMGWD